MGAKSVAGLRDFAAAGLASKADVAHALGRAISMAIDIDNFYSR
jgi:hypothetical protein